MKKLFCVFLSLMFAAVLFSGTVFAEENGFLDEINLRYDDRYDISGKTVEIVDSGKPVSYKVGYGIAEGTLDDAVITLSGEKIIAIGIGTAKVRIDGILYEIKVEAAPISLLLLIGQSNMEGMAGNVNQSIANADGQVYSTYAMANGLTGDAGLTTENAGNYVPSALTGEQSAVNINGNDTKLSGYPVNTLTESGKGKYGMDSGIAYEWVKQTGEKVWVVNAAHGASGISSWQKGESNFEEAVALLSACQGVLKKEIAAGHYTFSHMAYYWCQGCADEQQTAKWYAEKYIAMHDNLKAELAFDADLDETTEDVTFESGNIVLVMAGHETATGYRKGIYEDDSDKFFATFKELEMRGPRVAQIWLANNPELEDIYIVSTIAQDWVTMPDGSDGVREYFASHYENGIIDYPTQVKQKDTWYKPTTPAEVKSSIHYNQVGYNEVGREAARNTMYILGIKEKPEIETTVKFYDWTGYKEVSEIRTVSKGISETLAVPMVYPCYESKSVTYTASENLEYLYYDLLDKESKGGILSDSLGQNEIPAVERETYSYRFELSEGEMVSVGGGVFTENPLNRADKTHKFYKATTPVILRRDKEWVVEFFSEQGERFIALSCQGWFSSKTEYSDNAYFIFKRTDSGKSIISFGEYKNQQYEYWGIKQGMADIDWDLPHVYSFRNVINRDGSNIIHIYIDNRFVGTATNRIINNIVTATDESYFSGKDFLFPFIGAGGTFALNSEQMIWMNIWENGHTHSCTGVTVPPDCTEMGYTDYTCSECGMSYQSDYVAAAGHAFGEWIVSKEATPYKKGEEYRQCGTCGFTETREIPENRYKSFRFELKEGELVSVTEGGFDENPVERAFSGQKVYKLSESIVLKHDKEWRVDFYSEDAARFMALSTTASSQNGQFYIFRSKTGSGVLSFGEYKDGLYENYGTLQRNVDTNWSQPHIYSFRNRLNQDETNTIEIYMDDVFVCTATDKIVNEVLKETGTSYLSGKDFVFPYIGASGFALGSNQIIWMEIHEDVNAKRIADINLDGSVDVMDTYFIRLIVAKLVEPTAKQIEMGDVDLDGKITAIDANIIRKYAIGIIKELPIA